MLGLTPGGARTLGHCLAEPTFLNKGPSNTLKPVWLTAFPYSVRPSSKAMAASD